MQTLREGYDGLGLVMVLNRDRVLFFATLVVALLLASWLGGL